MTDTTDDFNIIPDTRSEKEKMDERVNKVMTIQEKFQAYPPNKFEWDGNNLVITDEGKVKKKKGKPVGTSNVAYNYNGKFTPEKKRQFLKHLEQVGSVSGACSLVKISRRAYYNHRDKDPTFKKRVDQAIDSYRGGLEAEVHDRIMKGTKKIRKDGEGNVMETVLTDDNSLLLRALEKHDSSWGKKSQNESTVNVNHTSSNAVSKLAEALGVNLPDKSEEPIDITDYEER